MTLYYMKYILKLLNFFSQKKCTVQNRRLEESLRVRVSSCMLSWPGHSTRTSFASRWCKRLPSCLAYSVRRTRRRRRAAAKRTGQQKKEKKKLKSFSMLVGHYAGTQQTLWHSLHYIPSLSLSHSSSLFLSLYTAGNVGLRFRNLWHKNWQHQRRVSYPCVWFASMTAPKDLFIAAFKLAFPSVGAPCVYPLSLSSILRLELGLWFSVVRSLPLSERVLGRCAMASRTRWVIYLTDARPMPRVMSAQKQCFPLKTRETERGRVSWKTKAQKACNIFGITSGLLPGRAWREAKETQQTKMLPS